MHLLHLNTLRLKTLLSSVSLVWALLCASACGGEEPVLSLSEDVLTFQNHDGRTPPQKRFSARVSNLKDPVYVGVAFSDQGLQNVRVELSGAEMIIHASVKDQNLLGLGTFEDVIVVAACKDELCKEHIQGSPQQLKVLYTIRSEWSAEPKEISIAHVLGGGSLGPKSIQIYNPLSLEWTAQNVIPVDLTTMTMGAPWAVDSSVTAITYTRPNGKGLILTDRHSFHDATTGAAIPRVRFPLHFGGSLRASVDGRTLCRAADGLQCYRLRYTDHQGGAISSVHLGGVSDVPRDAVINPDGTRVYSAPFADGSFFVHDGQGMERIATWSCDSYPSALAVGPDERVFVASYTRNGPKDVWVYEQTGTLLGTYRAVPAGKVVLEQQLKLSGDGKRFVTITDGPTLDFLSAP